MTDLPNLVKSVSFTGGTGVPAQDFIIPKRSGPSQTS
jgi:hypothetical protein